MAGRFCCVIDCEADAEFEILGGSGHLEDQTDACGVHVGTLLGTPDWLPQRYGAGRENREWTVVAISGVERRWMEGEKDSTGTTYRDAPTGRSDAEVLSLLLGGVRDAVVNHWIESEMVRNDAHAAVLWEGVVDAVKFGGD